MRTLTRILAPAITAAIALGSIAPASAADWRHDARPEVTRFAPAPHPTFRHDMFRADINDLRRDINRTAARRMISPREAAGLRNEVFGIQRLHALYARNGLNRREANMLERRIDQVKIALRSERHDRDGRRY